MKERRTPSPPRNHFPPTSLPSAISIQSPQDPELLPDVLPFDPPRLASSCVSAEGLAPLASGLSHCRHLEELE